MRRTYPSLIILLCLIVPAVGPMSCGEEEEEDKEEENKENETDPDDDGNDFTCTATGPGAGVWQPGPATTWQWQLDGAIDTSLDVKMYDIDLFNAPEDTIAALKADDRKVICYFSAGSFENWRDDAAEFEQSDYGNELEGWDGEWWLDIRSKNVRNIIKDRLDSAVSKGCDGVEPDNVDAYANDSGFNLTKADQLEFNCFLAEEAHKRALSVGLKNAGGLVNDLVLSFDWALNEECFAYNECEETQPFIDAGKAVFHVEYVDDTADGPTLKDEVCGSSSINGFSTLIKDWDLTSWYLACD